MTDFPIDMVIYREGVKAFMAGGEVYSQPMMAGDIALPFIYPPFGALVMVPLAGDWTPDAMAGDIMITLSNLLIGLIVLLLAFALNKQRTTPFVSSDVISVAALIWGIVLIFEPVRLNNGFAQINIIIMVLSHSTLSPQAPEVAAAGLADCVAAAIKITPGHVVAFLLRKEIADYHRGGLRGHRNTNCRRYPMGRCLGILLHQATVHGLRRRLWGRNRLPIQQLPQGCARAHVYFKEAMEFASSSTNIIWLCLAIITVVLGGWLMVVLMKRGLNIEAWLINSFIMLLISPVSWSHHWVWLAIALPVLLYRAITWRHLNWFSGVLISILGLWSVQVLTLPPKWYWGDGINVWEFNLIMKFMMNDFVWLSALTMLALAYMLRFVPVQAKPAPEHPAST